MDQTPAHMIGIPDINVTDEQGNVKVHSSFPFPGFPVVLQHRSRTFNTLDDACQQQSARLQGTQEVNNINNSMQQNGFLT